GQVQEERRRAAVTPQKSNRGVAEDLGRETVCDVPVLLRIGAAWVEVVHGDAAVIAHSLEKDAITVTERARQAGWVVVPFAYVEREVVCLAKGFRQQLQAGSDRLNTSGRLHVRAAYGSEGIGAGQQGGSRGRTYRGGLTTDAPAAGGEKVQLVFR